MTSKLLAISFATLTGAAFSPWLQDPPPPAAAPTPAEVPGKPKPHPLEGVYELRKRVIDRREDRTPARGYLVVTHRHLFVCLSAPGPDAEQPLLRAGVRTWKAREEQVTGTVQLGWFTDRDGGVHIERTGTEEVRRMQLIQGGVRVMQDERNWLEFERVE